MANNVIKTLPRSTRAKITKIQRINKRINRIKANTKLAKAKSASRQASLNARLQSPNPIVRKFAEHEQISKIKQDARLRKIEANTQTKELKPSIVKQQADADAKIKVAKAQSRAKFAGYAALAQGASQLGRGLAEENNQDDAAERKHSIDIIKAITDEGNEDNPNSALKQGVM